MNDKIKYIIYFLLGMIIKILYNQLDLVEGFIFYDLPGLSELAGQRNGNWPIADSPTMGLHEAPFGVCSPSNHPEFCHFLKDTRSKDSLQNYTVISDYLCGDVLIPGETGVVDMDYESVFLAVPEVIAICQADPDCKAIQLRQHIPTAAHLESNPSGLLYKLLYELDIDNTMTSCQRLTDRQNDTSIDVQNDYYYYIFKDSIQDICGVKYLSYDNLCQNCNDGQSRETGESECSDCSSGKYSNSSTNHVCVDCPLRQSSLSGSSSCFCEDDGVSAGINGVCERCLDGHKPNEDNTMCIECETGTAGTGGICQPCQGRQVPSFDKTNCIECTGTAVGEGINSICYSPHEIPPGKTHLGPSDIVVQDRETGYINYEKQQSVCSIDRSTTDCSGSDGWSSNDITANYKKSGVINDITATSITISSAINSIFNAGSPVIQGTNATGILATPTNTTDTVILVTVSTGTFNTDTTIYIDGFVPQTRMPTNVSGWDKPPQTLNSCGKYDKLCFNQNTTHTSGMCRTMCDSITDSMTEGPPESRTNVCGAFSFEDEQCCLYKTGYTGYTYDDVVETDENCYTKKNYNELYHDLKAKGPDSYCRTNRDSPTDTPDGLCICDPSISGVSDPSVTPPEASNPSAHDIEVDYSKHICFNPNICNADSFSYKDYGCHTYLTPGTELPDLRCPYNSIEGSTTSKRDSNILSDQTACYCHVGINTGTNVYTQECMSDNVDKKYCKIQDNTCQTLQECESSDNMLTESCKYTSSTGEISMCNYVNEHKVVDKQFNVNNLPEKCKSITECENMDTVLGDNEHCFCLEPNTDIHHICSTGQICSASGCIERKICEPHYTYNEIINKCVPPICSYYSDINKSPISNKCVCDTDINYSASNPLTCQRGDYCLDSETTPSIPFKGCHTKDHLHNTCNLYSPNNKTPIDEDCFCGVNSSGIPKLCYSDKYCVDNVCKDINCTDDQIINPNDHTKCIPKDYNDDGWFDNLFEDNGSYNILDNISSWVDNFRKENVK